MVAASHIKSQTFLLQSNENLGAVEITTFISLVLFGISLSQGYTYFRRSGQDRPSLKAFVVILLLLDGFHSFTAAHTIYDDSVTRWDSDKPNSYPLSVNVMAESNITFIVQCFFTHRIHRLSQRLLISAACLSLVVLRFVAAMALSVESILDVPKNPNGLFVVTFDWLITTGLALGGAADLSIATFMVYYLRKLFSPANLNSTTEVLNRLVRWSLQTGLLTSMTSVTVIICFQSMANMVWFGVYIILAKLYSLSLLVSLNARPGPGDQGDRGISTALQFESVMAPISVIHLIYILYGL
ncbi:hypothetical protein BDZ97DRAFT_1913273 [Flammula alnicola]|nr:hypothetical protein BDZ97DRAFT_1913273 [Flammula alnicola]